MLPREARLRRNREFQAVYRVRKSWSSPSFTLYVRLRANTAAPSGGVNRFGFVISKKIAKRAHDRNRLKRRLREICRALLLTSGEASRSWDAVFVARSSAPQVDFRALTEEVSRLGRQAGLLP